MIRNNMPLGMALFLFFSLFSFGKEPTLRYENGLVLTFSPQLLAIPEIRQQLESGLTTTLLIGYRVGLEGHDGKKEDVICISLRFEPWEERFFLEWQQAKQPVKYTELEAWDGLLQWWQTQRWTLVGPEEAGLPQKGTVRITWELIPFSEMEQDRALQLLVNPVATSVAPGSEGSRQTESPGSSQLMNLLLQTAAKRKAIIRFQWSLPVDF